MALPEDFSKIYGSTATGGLTPISNVNYAKGWEFVGSNPPTKNDFSYLQNLSDLKSQWLYSNKLQRTNPFGDIKSDGAAAVSKALENLGLGGAAKRAVGTGENQIPDMSSFYSIKTNSYLVQKNPSGLIEQWFNSAVADASGIAVANYPVAFPNKVIAVFCGELTASITSAAGVISWGECFDVRTLTSTKLRNNPATQESCVVYVVGY